MERPNIYAAIDLERIDQDKVWRKGRPNEAQYKFAAPHILLLEHKIAKLRNEWYMSEHEDHTKTLIQIAALAVRALEEIQ